METKLEAAIEGWVVDGDHYVRTDGAARVNRSFGTVFKRPFAVFPKTSYGSFCVWAPHRYKTATAAMKAADQRFMRDFI